MEQRVATKFWPFERMRINHNCLLIYVVLHDDLNPLMFYVRHVAFE